MSHNAPRKGQAAAEKRRKQQRLRRGIGGVALAIALVGAAVWALLALTGDTDDDQPIAASGASTTTFTGGARLVVDQPTIDRGDVAYNEPVNAIYSLRNDGDQPLTLGTPTINVLEGC